MDRVGWSRDRRGVCCTPRIHLAVSSIAKSRSCACSFAPWDPPHQGQEGEDPDDEGVAGPGNGECIVRLVDMLPRQDGLHLAVAVVVERVHEDRVRLHRVLRSGGPAASSGVVSSL
jgi:hypothetical protein